MSSTVEETEQKEPCEAVSGHDSALLPFEEKSAAAFLFSKNIEQINAPRKVFELQTRLPNTH